MCETKVGAGCVLSASSRLARGCPPIPTPATGRSSITRAVSSTRSVRSLVIRLRSAPSTSLTATYAPAPITATSASRPTACRTRRSPVARASASVTTSSAAMLDCEYENKRPAHITATSPTSGHVRQRCVTSSASAIPIPSTTWRP